MDDNQVIGVEQVRIQRVQPLKLEDKESGGSDLDFFPTSLNRNEDYIDCKGLTLQDEISNDTLVRLERKNGDIQFQIKGQSVSLTQLLNNQLNYQFVSSPLRTSTTSTHWQDKTILTVQLIGTFRIGWSAVVDVNNANIQVASRLFDAGHNITIGAEHINRPSSTTNQETVGGFNIIKITGAEHQIPTYVIQFASKQYARTVGIQDANIEIWRIE